MVVTPKFNHQLVKEDRQSRHAYMCATQHHVRTTLGDLLNVPSSRQIRYHLSPHSEKYVEMYSTVFIVITIKTL